MVWLFCLLSVIAVTVSASEPPESVWVFTTAQLPALRRMDLATEVFFLDDIDKRLKDVAFTNPGNDERARQHATAILNSPRGQALLGHIKRNAQAVAMAWQSGIEKLPAVLVDEHFVVYGDYDVQSALHRVRQHRHHEKAE